MIDAVTRACPVIEDDTSPLGAQVVRVLDRLIATRGVPEVIPKPLVIRETETDTEYGRERRESIGNGEKPERVARAASDPDAAVARAPSTAGDPLPPSARLLLSEAFVGADASTLADKRGQILGTLTERGVLLGSGEWVRAADARHLNDACADILARLRSGALRKPSAAVRHVLLRLRDTYTEKRAERERATWDIQRGRGAPGAPSPTPVPLAQLLPSNVALPVRSSPVTETASGREAAMIQAWAEAHPERLEAVEQRVAREHPRCERGSLSYVAAVLASWKVEMLASERIEGASGSSIE